LLLLLLLLLALTHHCYQPIISIATQGLLMLLLAAARSHGTNSVGFADFFYRFQHQSFQIVNEAQITFS
jgi:hypothetical protein